LFLNKDKINQVLTLVVQKDSMPLPPSPAFAPTASSESIITLGNVRFTVLTSRLIRLEYSKDEVFEDRPSQAFWYRRQPVPQFRKSISEGMVEIETDDLFLRYRPTRLWFSRWTLSITLKSNGVIWHFGQSNRHAGNLKGTARTLDGDFGSTRLEDGLLSRTGWAVVDDSNSLVFNEKGWLEPRARKQKDLYFFGYGNDVASCLQDFTLVAGPIPMIPRYILGNWWSRYWEYSQDELQSLMEEFRSREIPLSVCIVDMDWHITKTGNTSDGWTGYTWNRELFPDPPGFIQCLHEQGLRTALNLHPARGIHPHEEQYEAMAKWMGVDPVTKEPIVFDITDPRFVEGYFDILHHPYEEMGVDFWWVDWQQGRKSPVPGLDPLWWINHLHYYDLGRDGRKRPFVFSRWGGIGNHRYPIGFSGDTFVRWRTLAYQPYFTSSAANVGYGWWSHDIGGHMFKDGTPELYLRWVQFGVFSPIFRLHSTKKTSLDRRPWSKPERIFHAARDAMQLRHALIPYIYSMAWRAYKTGISLVTPMYYGNMEDASAFEAKDQYFFGSELLVAPILKPADPKTGFVKRKIWFPSGTWYNFFTGEQISGGEWREVAETLEDIPVFAKAGAIIPLAAKLGWGGIDNPDELDVYIFPGADNEFALYEDDGETTDYLQGKFVVTRFTFENGVFTIHPAEGERSLVPAKRTYRIHLRGVDGKEAATLPYSYDAANLTLSLEPLTLAPDQKSSTTFMTA
jgi:alpha-glucosidase (family GH31 glycosyl hydrolase)